MSGTRDASTRPRRLRWEEVNFIVRSLVVGVGAAIPGVLLLWYSTSFEDATWTTFWANIGTTFITVGLIGIAYESFLKRALMRDIERSTFVGTLLQGSGITQVSLEADSAQIREHFEFANALDVVPANPLTWHDRNYAWLTQLAKSRKIAFKVYLPEPTFYSGALRSIAAGDSAIVSLENCVAKFGEYQRSWESADAGSAGSTLEILYYKGYPHHEIFLGDTAAAIFVGDPLNAAPALTRVAYIYQGKNAKPTFDWLKNAVRMLKAAPILGAPRDERTAEEILPTSVDAAPTAVVGRVGEGDRA